MNLYFVRHGETEYNKSNFYYGKSDVSINEMGFVQAKKACEMLKNVNFNRAYISEMKRTKQTAKIILGEKKCDIIKDCRLNERNFGEFEGKDYDKIKKLYPENWKAFCEDWKDAVPPGGESFTQFYLKVKDFMDNILKINEDNILIVTHSGIIKSVYCYILDNNLDFFWKFSSKNGDITLIKYEYGNMYIDSISHV
ncbi:alpha-ribazole phosphatase [Clostridium sp. P21]|uniref:Alpha-ribazole phosphatase n=1 Tax=Clostridium muellerianum TaxID=2716538 RepID=A0A7Y0EGU5_9CLOT|nr:alpha-ribazole phosphatase [Clostridium muellerianum]NMM63208.1 alpha-ribazole phosphatase [Clostridium muellerianum]